MAPNFLSKLVKQPNANSAGRDRSLSSPSPPSESHSRGSSSADHATAANSVSSRTVGSNGSGPSRSNSLYSKSANPSVTVIPPSPVVSQEPVPDLPTYKPTDNVLPPTDRPPIPTKPVPRPPTPKSKEKQRTPKSSPKIETANLPAPPSLRPQSSNKSLKSKGAEPLPVPIPISHMRAATSPPSTLMNGDGDSSEPIPLSESPTALRPTDIFPRVSGSPPSSISPAKRRDTDVFSVTSQGQKKGTGRPWKRSATKKPMGLAGAIAASGLAMANPALTAPQQSTLSPQVMNTNNENSGSSLVTSPMQNPMATRRLTASPESNHRRIHSGGGTSNGRGGRQMTDHQRRRTTGSAMSHGDGEAHSPDEQGGYYSGLDSSDEGSGDDSSDEGGSGLEDLDLGEDDIPVTGFAVASNKRNADFHELFPGIPEGDYLIEDYGCALQREILIQGRLYVSENHLCFHANIFGWVTDLLIPIYEITTLEKKMTAFVIPNAIRVGTGRLDYTFASFLSRDTTFDVIHNIWRLVRPSDAASIGSGSLEAGAEAGNLTIAEGTIIGAAGGGAAVGPQRKATTCACGKDGSHFAEVPLNTVFPGTPDRIYNLMFASGFMKDFMSVNQKLLDIQVSDWTPISPGSKLLARNMSYIKPLNASLGPKQTKCEIRDESVHVDFDDYITTLTTTRNPDVPSGGVFSVKTRTCIMWAGAFSTKVVVSTTVEWTGRSFIKGIIEKSAIDGQRVYHADLEKAMRTYIQEHQAEFMPAGVDPAAVAPPVEPTPSTPSAVTATETDNKKREKERSQRGLQWAWDTFDGAYSVAKQSTKGALELIHDAWENSTSSSILYALIVVLVASNLWTYMKMGSAVDKGRKTERELARAGGKDKDEWVAGVVAAMRDELKRTDNNNRPPVSPPISGAVTTESIKQEIGALQASLDSLEERARTLRSSLNDLS
ncbi:VASt domain-containing protein [Mycena indigotica]|uniref:VASt domain-containing protein n=1 Tax=Mycena indigotica TaxID=2126181 RepID=A0A8H6W358_9AGAR|nr:VASt domain-containing protein [Mycena indigotica]KAF7301201.1 VASt domain-containing protein [Mycena indigotica]